MRLEGICGNFEAVQLHRKPIATFFLWATQVEILDESHRSDRQSDITRFFDLWNQIHLANPAPTITYLDALLSCLNVDLGRVKERPGSEQGARVASLCLLCALASVDPTSTLLTEIRRRYVAAIPTNADFEGLLCYHAINAVHATLVGGRLRRFFEWTDYKPHAQEHVFFTNPLVQFAHKLKQYGKVPRWLLRFAIHSLSHNSPPPIPVVTGCLTIIAIDLGCDVSHVGTLGLPGRYVDFSQPRTFLTARIVHNQRFRA